MAINFCPYCGRDLGLAVTNEGCCECLDYVCQCGAEFCEEDIHVEAMDRIKSNLLPHRDCNQRSLVDTQEEIPLD